MLIPLPIYMVVVLQLILRVCKPHKIFLFYTANVYVILPKIVALFTSCISRLLIGIIFLMSENTNNSASIGLLEINSPGFVYLKNIFISPPFLKDIFAGMEF